MPTTGPVSGITLAADTAQTDPLFTATGETNGGGDTGSVLISPYIKPGTSSYDYYNHYSWLRTMEDLFGVASTSPGSTVSATSATPRSPVWRRSAPTCSTTSAKAKKPIKCKKGSKLKKGKCVKVKKAKKPEEAPSNQQEGLSDAKPAGRRCRWRRDEALRGDEHAVTGMQASRAFGPGSRPCLNGADGALAGVTAAAAAVRSPDVRRRRRRQQSTDRGARVSPAAAHISSALRAQEEAIHQQVLASLHHLSDKTSATGRPPATALRRRLRIGSLSASGGDPVLSIEGDTVASCWRAPARSRRRSAQTCRTDPGHERAAHAGELRPHVSGVHGSCRSTRRVRDHRRAGSELHQPA